MTQQIETWHLRQMRCKPDKAVVRLYKPDGTFLEAVNIPSVRWPLNGSYELFHHNNCKLIEDPAVAKIVDAIPYHIGHCYSNSESVTAELVKHGYSAQQYVGWMFFSGVEYPIHHSWTVLNGKHIIDLSAEHGVLDYNRDKFNNLTTEETRKLFVAFSKWIRQYPNSQRTAPFGLPVSRLLYIGCPCSRMEGVNIYNTLMRMYPDHPCSERVRDDNCRTEMQQMLAEAGIT